MAKRRNDRPEIFQGTLEEIEKDLVAAQSGDSINAVVRYTILTLGCLGCLATPFILIWLTGAWVLVLQSTLRSSQETSSLVLFSLFAIGSVWLMATGFRRLWLWHLEVSPRDLDNGKLSSLIRWTQLIRKGPNHDLDLGYKVAFFPTVIRLLSMKVDDCAEDPWLEASLGGYRVQVTRSMTRKESYWRASLGIGKKDICVNWCLCTERIAILSKSAWIAGDLPPSADWPLQMVLSKFESESESESGWVFQTPSARIAIGDRCEYEKLATGERLQAALTLFARYERQG